MIAFLLAQTIAITGGTVYPVSGPKLENATVLIRDGRIAAVGTSVAVPNGATRIDATGDKDWFTGEAFAAFADELAASPDRDAARAAGAALYRYALAMARDDAAAAADFEAAVRRLVPDVVAGAEQEAPITTLADARRTLSDLEDEQARVHDRLEAVERRLEALDRRP